jgi:hypothetical protein
MALVEFLLDVEDRPHGVSNITHSVLEWALGLNAEVEEGSYQIERLGNQQCVLQVVCF